MISAIQTALTGLAAATKKIGATADNIANLDTTGRLDGKSQKPYSTVITAQQALPGGAGVQASVTQKSPGFVPAYDPGSPFADENGLIGVPATDLAEEFVNLSIAKTTYKANAAVIRTASAMEDDLLKTFDKRV